jgi:hypothetical protein
MTEIFSMLSEFSGEKVFSEVSRQDSLPEALVTSLLENRKAVQPEDSYQGVAA